MTMTVQLDAQYSDEEFSKILGEDLFYIRNSLKFTNLQMAEKFGVCSRQYTRWERSGVKKIDLRFWLTMHSLIQQYAGVANKFMVNEVTKITAAGIFCRCQKSIDRTRVQNARASG
jgi:hypothetical protein